MLLKKFCFPETPYLPYFNRYTKKLAYFVTEDMVDRLPDMSIRVETSDEEGNKLEYPATIKFVGIYIEDLYYIDLSIDRRKVQVTNYKNSYSYILGGNGNFKRFVKNAPVIW